MSYIRTKDNEILKVLYSMYDDCVEVYFTEKGIITEKSVLKEADTLDKICDIFKNVNIYAGSISFTDYMNFELARFNKSDEATLYGYIYIVLPNGAVRIEPVAKMNEKGDLQLL